MADFFNKLKKSIDKGTAIVGAKSTTLIETNKIKQDISATTRLKKDTLLELGKKVYAMNLEGDFTIDAVEELLTKISEAEAKIEDMEAKITLLQDEEKSKMEEINAEAEAPVDVTATEVAEPVAPVEAAAPVDAAEAVAPVAAAEPVVAEASEEVAEEVQENQTGEYNG